MSSTEAEKLPAFGLRRLRRPEKRVLFWVGRLKTAPSGDKALTDVWGWLRKELAELEDKRPEAAEAARYHVARQVATLASQMPQAKIALRAGITEAEERQLLDPWGKPQEES